VAAAADLDVRGLEEVANRALGAIDHRPRKDLAAGDHWTIPRLLGRRTARKTRPPGMGRPPNIQAKVRAVETRPAAASHPEERAGARRLRPSAMAARSSSRVSA
jgi:hypothetical protein